LEHTRRERASLVSCVGEPLKRNVRRFSSDETIEKLGMENEDDGPNESN